MNTDGSLEGRREPRKADHAMLTIGLSPHCRRVNRAVPFRSGEGQNKVYLDPVSWSS